MEKIEEVDLKELVTEASAELLQQRRKGASSLIKKMLIYSEGVIESIRCKKTELKGLEKILQTQTEKMARLRSGDWSVLVEKTKEKENAKDND